MESGRWAEEEEAAAWEPGGAVVEGESPARSTRLLVLQSIAELGWFFSVTDLAEAGVECSSCNVVCSSTTCICSSHLDISIC